MASTQLFKDRNFLAVIGDEVNDVSTMLTPGLGNWTASRGNRTHNPGPKEELPDSGREYLSMQTSTDEETETSTIEKTFDEFTQRKDIAILLISQHVAEKIRYRLDNYTAAFPTVLEIPSKEHPYGNQL